MRTGDVVIFVPVLKPLALLTMPVREPSLFCLNFDKTGMSSCLAAAPNRENPPESFFGLAFFSAIVPERRTGVEGAFLVEASLTLAGAGGLGELPKKEKDDLGTGVGDGATLGAGAGFGLPKNEKGCTTGGEGAGGVATGFGGLAKKEKGCGAGFDNGAGTAFGDTLGAGAGLLKNENDGNGPLFATDFGAGFDTGFASGIGAGLETAFGAGFPKKLKPVSIAFASGFETAFGAGFATTFGVDGTDDPFETAFGAGFPKKLKVVSTFVSVFEATIGAGVEATFGFGFDAAFGFGFVGSKKLNNGAGAGDAFLAGSAIFKMLERSISTSNPLDTFSGSCGAGFGTNDSKMDFGCCFGFVLGVGALRALNFSCLSSHSRACRRACSAASRSNCLRFAT